MVRARHPDLLSHQDLTGGGGSRWVLNGQTLASVWYHFLVSIICKFVHELLPKATAVEMDALH